MPPHMDCCKFWSSYHGNCMSIPMQRVPIFWLACLIPPLAVRTSERILGTYGHFVAMVNRLKFIAVSVSSECISFRWREGCLHGGVKHPGGSVSPLCDISRLVCYPTCCQVVGNTLEGWGTPPLESIPLSTLPWPVVISWSLGWTGRVDWWYSGLIRQDTLWNG